MKYNHQLVLSTEKWLAELTFNRLSAPWILYESSSLKRFNWEAAWSSWIWMDANPGWRIELRYQGLCRAMEIAAGKKRKEHLAERQRVADEWQQTRDQWIAESDDPYIAIKNGWKKPETVEEYRAALINGMGHVQSASTAVNG